MKAAASMAAPLAVGELAALLKTRRYKAAAAAKKVETQAAAGAAAATAAARILLDVFAVAEHAGEGGYRKTCARSCCCCLSAISLLGRQLTCLQLWRLRPRTCFSSRLVQLWQVSSFLSAVSLVSHQPPPRLQIKIGSRLSYLPILCSKPHH